MWSLLEDDPELLVATASAFAAGAHFAVKQVRKYTGEPYINHPARVAALVGQAEWFSPSMIAAAMLHDVLEDTGVTRQTILQLFGDVVEGFVVELTDEYTPEKYPDSNREERKSMEAARMVNASFGAKTIKLADCIDNTEDIGENDPKFMKTYGPEKRRLLESLRGGDAGLWATADKILRDYGY